MSHPLGTVGFMAYDVSDEHCRTARDLTFLLRIPPDGVDAADLEDEG